MGGVIIGYEIGRLLKKETIFSERVDGKFKLRRDFSIKKKSESINHRGCNYDRKIKSWMC